MKKKLDNRAYFSYTGSRTIEKEEIEKMFIVVMPDGETWDTEATLVRVTDDQIDEIQSGEKVSNVVDLSDGSVAYPLGVEALNIFL